MAGPDWSTLASLGTAAGTLVLAIATFASVRASGRTARVAEESLLASVRPLLMPSHLQDDTQKVVFGDGHWVELAGGTAVVEPAEDVVYLTMSLRNAGNGIAVLDGWRLERDTEPGRAQRPELDDFRRLTRDLYVAAGEIGFWQGALRDPDDADRAWIGARLADHEPLVVDLLYSDHQGGQRVVSRFRLPRHDEHDVGDGDGVAVRLTNVVRHWNLDRPDPR